MTRTAVVTGAAGFVGSNLANALAADGHRVVAVDDEFLGERDNLTEAVDYHYQSVLDDGLPVSDADAIYHLAALSSRGMHEDDPCRGARVNVEGFVNVCEQARTAGCDSVVYASTSSIYDDLPGSVDDSVTARTAYEASKLSRERYAEYYREMHDMDVCGLRLFSVYAGMTEGEAHKGNYANIISQFASKIADGESPVIWGDGTQTRDFTHVEDVVRAFRHCAVEGIEGTYNVGTGDPHTFNEVVDAVNAALEVDVEPAYEPVPLDNYVYHTEADVGDAPPGWWPRVGFEEGVRRVCSRYRS